MKNREYSWEEFLMDVPMIANQIKEADLSIENIYGLPRGGLIFAVLLSHELDLPLIVDQAQISRKTLVVDDISDTGSQLNQLFESGQEFRYSATLWKRSTTKFEPTFCANAVEDDSWITFPWEK